VKNAVSPRSLFRGRSRIYIALLVASWVTLSVVYLALSVNPVQAAEMRPLEDYIGKKAFDQSAWVVEIDGDYSASEQLVCDWKEPDSVLCLVGLRLDIASAWLSETGVQTSISEQDGVTPSFPITYVTVSSDGVRKAHSVEFDLDDKTSLSSKLAFVARLVTEYQMEYFAPALSEVDPDSEEALQALSLPWDAYYSSPQTTGMRTWPFLTSGKTYYDGSITWWFSTKVVLNDQDPTYDYWFVHMKEDIRPGEYLVGGTAMGLFDLKTKYTCGTGKTMSSFSPTGTNNNSIAVSGIGWGLSGFSPWSYPPLSDNYFYGSISPAGYRLNAPLDYEVEGKGTTSYVAFYHHAKKNDWSNYNRILHFEPGFDQRVADGQKLRVTVEPGSGTSGSQVIFAPYWLEEYYQHDVPLLYPALQWIIDKPSS